MAPQLAAHVDAITLDPALFARIDTLFAARHDLGLDPESLRLLERRHRDAVRAGARLGPAEQDRLRALNAELSALTTEFGRLLLAEANDSAVHVDDPARLDGLAPDAVSAAARAAAARGLDGYLITMVLPTEQPALASLTDRDLRERVHTRVERPAGSRGNDHDARDWSRRIAELRAERAGPARAPAPRVLGGRGRHRGQRRGGRRDAAASWPRWPRPTPGPRRPSWPRSPGTRSSRGTARSTPSGSAAGPVRRRRRRAAPLLRAGPGAARRGLPRRRPALRAALQPSATTCLATTPTCASFDVLDEHGPLGLFVADFYARDAKRGGAWMNPFVTQSQLLGTRPVVMNTLNIARPADGEPTLLTLDNVRTLFHEFGHALHGLFSDVRYPTFAGTGVPRDFVEYPSQVNEMWLDDPEILAHYARHHETGEPLPAELVARLAGPARFGEGFATTEYLAAALLDQAWHRLGPGRAGDRRRPVRGRRAGRGRHRGAQRPAALPQHLLQPRLRWRLQRRLLLLHLERGARRRHRGVVRRERRADRENGERFRRGLLARGGAVDPMEAYRAFRGRDPEIGPLLARRGLAS